MDKYLPSALPALLLSASCVSAEPVKWLEDGSAMHATTSEAPLNRTDATANSDTEQDVVVTLATGQDVILTGGVYVKTENTAAVLAWAMSNDYIALESPYIPGAIEVETTAEDSIAVANQIAELEGVNTAAPKYRKPLVPK